jgi:hypothetical protein
MPSPNRPKTHRLRLTCYGAVLGVALALPATGLAWGVKAFYPMTASPHMPTPQEAQRLAAEPPLLLRSIGSAHRQSLQLGWKGIAPPQPLRPTD